MAYDTVLRKFYECKVRYLIVGGLAMNLHGVPRMTADLDIIVATDEANMRSLISALEEIGYRPRLPVVIEELLEPAIREVWIKDRNLIAFSFVNDQNRAVEVDVVLHHTLDFEKAYNYRSIIRVSDYEISLISIDDLQSMKLSAARLQDEADVEMLERVKRELYEG